MDEYYIHSNKIINAKIIKREESYMYPIEVRRRLDDSFIDLTEIRKRLDERAEKSRAVIAKSDADAKESIKRAEQVRARLDSGRKYVFRTGD